MAHGLRKDFTWAEVGFWRKTDVCMLSHFSHVALCDPMDCSLSGFCVQGTLQGRILEWVAISFSRRSSWPRDWTHISHVSWTDRWVLDHWCHLACMRPPSPFQSRFSLSLSLKHANTDTHTHTHTHTHTQRPEESLWALSVNLTLETEQLSFDQGSA